MYTLIALPMPCPDLIPLAREYRALIAAQTRDKWDRTEEQLSAIIVLIPPAYRRRFHAMVWGEK
jgi:hypothetical protein